jgi:hypothetical protein
MSDASAPDSILITDPTTVPGPQGDVGPSGQRGSIFMPPVATFADLPSVDDDAVHVGDVAYVVDNGDLWRATDNGWTYVDHLRGVPGLSVAGGLVTDDGRLVLRMSDGSGFEVGVVRGMQGSPGQNGTQGPQGERGPAGSKGDTGPQGIAGPVGPKGDVGAAGPSGAQGVQGLKGDTGSTGAIGPVGPQGQTGSQGPIGPTGAQGTQGPIGLTGPAGVAGATGATGPAGAAGKDANTRTATINLATATIGIGLSRDITVTWPTPFADANYKVNAPVPIAPLLLNAVAFLGIVSQTAASCVVRLNNISLGALTTGTLTITAVHD